MFKLFVSVLFVCLLFCFATTNSVVMFQQFCRMIMEIGTKKFLDNMVREFQRLLVTIDTVTCYPLYVKSPSLNPNLKAQ